MHIFDTINDLESYLAVVPNLDKLIDILDRSLPYEMTNGSDMTSGIKYKVETYNAKEKGFFIPNENCVLILTLDGRQMVTTEEGVFVLNEGSFLILDASYSKGIAIGNEETVRDCVFTLD